MDLIEARDEAAAEALVIAWFARVDAALVRDLEAVLGPSASRNGAPAKKATRAKQASPPAPAAPAKQASRVKQGNRKASNQERVRS